MANQIIIDIGATANDGTGDPLRTAFDYVNDNFSNVWNTGLPNSNVQFSNNKILTTNTNANLVLSPNGIGKVVANVDIRPNANNTLSLGSSNLRWNSVYAQNLDIGGNVSFNNLTINGNLTVQGNTIQIGNIVTDTKTIQLANTAATANAANGSGVTVGANDNIATLLYSNTANVWTTNIGVSSAGNITAPYFFGNGSQLTGLPATYGNANVATFLAAYGSNTISTSGNVTGNYFVGNGSQLTGLSTSSISNGTSNVLIDTANGNVTVTSAGNTWNFSTNGNLTLPADGFLRVTSGIVGTGASPAPSLSGFGSVSAVTVSASGNISAVGNVTAGNISAGSGTITGGNVNGAVFNGNVAFGTGTVGGSGNITGGNLITTGSGGAITMTGGNITGAGNIVAVNVSTTGNIISGNVNTGKITLTNGTVIKDTTLGAIAIGLNAGQTTQGTHGVAIGTQAGSSGQGAVAVAIGLQAGYDTQAVGAVAIGSGAGYITQGANAVAIGSNAGQSSQANNSIIINATGAVVNQTTANTFTVAPVRNDVANTAEVMFYNATSKEITYGNTIGVAGNITSGNVLTGGLISATGNVTANNLALAGNITSSIGFTGATITINNAPGGNEGAEVIWALPSPANTVLTTSFVQDVFQNGMRFFESGGNSRGLYMDLGNVPNGSGTAVGYRDIPQVSFTANTTIATTDAGRHYYSTLSTSNVLTIANNASQSFQTGAAITIVNQGTGAITVAQGSGVTLYLAGNATSGNRTLATFGMATIMKVATNTWFINGTGVS